MKTLDKITANGLPTRLVQFSRACGMRVAALATVTVFLFSISPTSSAFPDICSLVGGGVGMSADLCLATENRYADLDFHVTAACVDCNGRQWQVQSLSSRVTGDCSHNCGAVFLCYGCNKEISPNRIDFWASAVQKSWTSGGCRVDAIREARVSCLCDTCLLPDPGSPILMSMTDGRYELTSAADGVHFDLNADGTAELTAWTAAGSDEAFLALDRNGNGYIDDFRELFGDKTPQFPSAEPNGWRALAIWDDSLNGGNEDGRIDANDYIFSSLRLWIDENHNGFSEASELFSLGELDLVYLDLDFRKAERRDRFGNTFRYWSKVGSAGRGLIIAWDVFFVTLP